MKRRSQPMNGRFPEFVSCSSSIEVWPNLPPHKSPCVASCSITLRFLVATRFSRTCFFTPFAPIISSTATDESSRAGSCSSTTSIAASKIDVRLICISGQSPSNASIVASSHVDSSSQRCSHLLHNIAQGCIMHNTQPGGNRTFQLR